MAILGIYVRFFRGSVAVNIYTSHVHSPHSRQLLMASYRRWTMVNCTRNPAETPYLSPKNWRVGFVLTGSVWNPSSSPSEDADNEVVSFQSCYIDVFFSQKPSCECDYTLGGSPRTKPSQTPLLVDRGGAPNLYLGMLRCRIPNRHHQKKTRHVLIHHFTLPLFLASWVPEKHPRIPQIIHSWINMSMSLCLENPQLILMV